MCIFLILMIFLPVPESPGGGPGAPHGCLPPPVCWSWFGPSQTVCLCMSKVTKIIEQSKTPDGFQFTNCVSQTIFEIRFLYILKFFFFSLSPFSNKMYLSPFFKSQANQCLRESPANLHLSSPSASRRPSSCSKTSAAFQESPSVNPLLKYQRTSHSLLTHPWHMLSCLLRPREAGNPVLPFTFPFEVHLAEQFH